MGNLGCVVGWKPETRFGALFDMLARGGFVRRQWPVDEKGCYMLFDVRLYVVERVRVRTVRVQVCRRCEWVQVPLMEVA